MNFNYIKYAIVPLSDIRNYQLNPIDKLVIDIIISLAKLKSKKLIFIKICNY